MSLVDYVRIEFGTCPCLGAYEHRAVEVRLNVGGKVIVLTGVPQGACRRCGSRVYKSEVLERIESLMQGAKVKKQTV